MLFACMISHENGHALSIHRTYEQAFAHVAAYCREEWDCEGDPPANDEEMVEAYYNQRDFDTYEIQECAIAP